MQPGATILFLAPGFYHGAETIDQLVDFVVSRLRPFLSGLRVSRYVETVPVDVPGPQPLFLNGAAVGEGADTAES